MTTRQVDTLRKLVIKLLNARAGVVMERDEYKRQVDEQREYMDRCAIGMVRASRDIDEITHKLYAAQSTIAAQERELITLRTDRDVLMSELGEANQAVTVMEEKTS